ncbi:MAG TPA: ATP-binding protein [Pyrinomonadaceae bacterium]|jgi:serine/threonine-protein kinase RsbW
MNQNPHQEIRQVLGRVKRDEFIGRATELQKLVSHAMRAKGFEGAGRPGRARGLLMLLAPLAGVSELLRQAYDELFNQREVVPIYFALPQTETTAVSAAIEFLNTFLLQYIAYRRGEPSLCRLSLTLNDLVQLAPAGDLPWIEELIEAYNLQRFGKDDRELVRFCLTAPNRVPASNGRPFVMFDAVQLANYLDSAVPLATEIVRALLFSNLPFALAGLRREVLDAVACAGGNFGSLELMRLESLKDDEARDLVVSAASRHQVAINEETRDLMVQQFEGSPFFITAMLQAAHERNLTLDSYLACERLYVDELMGGRLNRYFSSVLEHLAPETETRAAVIRLLCEAVPTGSRTSSLEAWRKRLNLDSIEAEQLLRALHIQELINWDGQTVDATGSSSLWKDYLKSRFRLDALREPRALVVADVMADALKRAPQTIARHYRKSAGLRLRGLLDKFNFQLVPKRLFDSAEFASSYKGATAEEIAAGLDADTELLRLPQVFHTASGVSFSPELRQFGEESSVVAHAFEGGNYTDANEIVWLVAKVDSKLEADRNVTATWLDRLESLARQSGFSRAQTWLIANEGFSAEATELLRERNAYGSSQQQFELLSDRLTDAAAALQQSVEANEFTLILPMGGDNELLAATTVEQLARRLNFSPEAINQIKTAVVEACINAAEHSLSPDQKIYQRFRVESDKLVITISSRGIVPANIQGHIEERQREQLRHEDNGEDTEQRRGWGLKLIKTLMDEVEFERVDEGTSLRMTKYLRKAS